MVVFIFLSLLFAESKYQNKKQCSPRDIAQQSVLLEACKTNESFCYLLLSTRDKDSKNSEVFHSIIEMDIINETTETDPTKKLLMPHEYVQITSNGKSETYQYQGVFNFYDNRVRARNGFHENFYMLRTLDDKVLMLPIKQIQSIQKLPDNQLHQQQWLKLFHKANIKAGTKFVNEAGEWVIDELQGQIVDQSSRYIFLRQGNKRIRYPLQQYIHKVSDQLPPSAISQARHMVKAGGKAKSLLLKSPIGNILEMSLSPNMAACADASNQFVANTCSRDPLKFHDWYRQLSPYDREEVLKDPASCEIMNNILEREMNQLSRERKVKLENFKKNWMPKKIQCGGDEGVEFVLDKDSLNPESPTSQNIYYRYTIQYHCLEGSQKCETFKIRTEKRMVGLDSVLSPPQHFIFSDPGIYISGRTLNTRKPRIASQAKTDGDLFLQRWLTDQVAKYCWNELTQRDSTLATDPNAPPGVTF